MSGYLRDWMHKTQPSVIARLSHTAGSYALVVQRCEHSSCVLDHWAHWGREEGERFLLSI